MRILLPASGHCCVCKLLLHSQRICFGTIILLVLQIMIPQTLIGQTGDPEYFNPAKEKRFFFSGGIGFGLANQPVFGSDKSTATGITLTGAVGFRFNRRFAFDFGPSFWLEGSDLFDGSAQNNERPQNRRMLVSINGYYRPVARVPIQIRTGIGVQSMVYSPKTQVVQTDKNGKTEAEITEGFGAVAGVMYEWELLPGIKIHPALNFWYGDLQKQKIEHYSLINHRKPSLVTELKINVFLYF